MSINTANLIGYIIGVAIIIGMIIVSLKEKHKNREIENFRNELSNSLFSPDDTQEERLHKELIVRLMVLIYRLS